MALRCPLFSVAESLQLEREVHASSDVQAELLGSTVMGPSLVKVWARLR